MPLLATAGAPAAPGGPRPAAARLPAATDGRAAQSSHAGRLDSAPATPGPRGAVVLTLPAQLLTPAGSAAAGPPIPIQLTAAMPGAMPAARPDAPPPPATTPPPAVPAGVGLPPGATLPAQSAGPDALGRPLLRVPGGITLRLDPGAVDLPPGARLSVTFPQGLPPNDRPRTARTDPLRTLAELLRTAGPEGGASAPAPSLPYPDAALAARLLRFHHAIQRNDAALLLPDDGGAVGEPEGAPALRDAVAELSRLAREPLPGGWRAMLLPVPTDGDATEPLRLYARDEDDAPPRDAGDGDRPRRAVFDLTLTRLGRLQLDALCRGSRFDLLVRSERPLPPDLRAEVAALFEAAGDAAGLRGELGFRPGGLLALPEPRAAPTRVEA